MTTFREKVFMGDVITAFVSQNATYHARSKFPYHVRYKGKFYCSKEPRELVEKILKEEVG